MENNNEKDKINKINKKILIEIGKENIIGVYGFTRHKEESRAEQEESPGCSILCVG